MGTWANIPRKRNREEPICFGPYLYRGRNLVERFFNKEVANACLELHVIASAAKQSILSYCGKMDCFASLAMTAWATDCFAEPVIGRAFARPVGCVPSMIGSLEVKVFYPA